MGKDTIKFEKGDTIIRSGDTEQRMYIIKKGEVEVSINDGTRIIVVATMKKNDFFGEISLFNKTPRSADVVAKTTTEVFHIDSAKDLDKFLAEDPTYAKKMVLTLGQRLANTDELLKKQMTGHGVAKVMGFSW